MSADFRNISAGIKRWVRRLKGKGTDKDHSDFMVSKFQGHMEDGLFHAPVADILDIYDRIIQWGSLLDRKRNELRNYFPSPTGGATIPVTALNTTTGPVSTKTQLNRDNGQNSLNTQPYHGDTSKSGVPYMHILWQDTPARVWTYITS